MTVSLSGVTTIDEVAEVIVTRGVPLLGASAGYFATVDPKSEELVLRVATGYSDAVIERYGSVPLSHVTPATDAVRNGMPILVESPTDRDERYPVDSEESHGAFIVVPVSVAQGVRAALSFGFDTPRVFTDDDRSYIAALIEACAQALQRAALFEAEQTSRQRLRTLLDASEALAALDDPEAVSAAIARIAAERVGRYATVQLLEPDGSVRQVAVAHADPEREADLRRLLAQDGARGGMARVTQRVAATGEPMVFRGLGRAPNSDSEVTQAVARLDQQSAVVVPLGSSRRVFGVLAIGDDRPESVGAPDVELALDLGRRCASALERVQLYQAEQLRAQEALRESEQRFEAEHRVVAALQQTIVPEALPDVLGVELCAAYRPADAQVDVGGDWYDAFVLDDGRLFLVIGDVAGHGVAAASLMGRVRNALRAVRGLRPGSRERPVAHGLSAVHARLRLDGHRVRRALRPRHRRPRMGPGRAPARARDDRDGAPVPGRRQRDPARHPVSRVRDGTDATRARHGPRLLHRRPRRTPGRRARCGPGVARRAGARAVRRSTGEDLPIADRVDHSCRTRSRTTSACSCCASGDERAEMTLLAVDIGGTKISAGVVDDDGTLIVREDAPTPLDDGCRGVVRARRQSGRPRAER